MGFERARRRGGDAPARFGDAWAWRRIQPQHQEGGACIARAEREAAPGGQIERGPSPPALDDHRRRPGAANCVIGAGEQQFGIGRLDQQQPVGIAAELRDAGGIELPAASARIGGAQPHQRRALRRTQREQRGKGGGTRRIERVGGEKFMQTPRRKPTVKRGVEPRMTARQPPRACPTRLGLAGDPGETPAQAGDRRVRLVGHDVPDLFY